MTSELLAASPRRPRWLREPLLHFVLLGAALFLLDHWLVSRADDPRIIVVDARVDDEARAVFKAARGREPNREELYALRRVWLDNEVLYREGLAMQLDKGDKAIRERVIFKALSVVDAGTRLPAVDDEVLREWFESHRDKYDEPARYNFQEAVLGGEKSPAALQALMTALNSGKQGDLEADLRVFTGRPHENLVQSYGAEFAKALEQSKPGQWQLLEGRGGARVVRLESVAAAEPAQFERMRNRVLQDWTDATLAEQRSAAVKALAMKYTVKAQDATE